MAEIGVIGGGVLGMTVALRLREAGYDVTLHESAPAAGGLAGPQEIGGYTWDRFYHVILLSDSKLRRLLDELDLEDRLKWGVTRTGFFTDGKLHSMSNSIEFLLFPPLNLIDKARLALTIAWAARVKDWKALEKIPVTTWLTKWSGKRTFERIWLPLLKSKLGDNFRVASAAFIWATIARMYAARRSGLKREMFGYVDGGYALVLSRFQDHLSDLGVNIELGSRISEVFRSEDGGLQVTDANGRGFEYERVVLTIPSGRIPDLVPQLREDEERRLRDVVYQGVVCVSVLLRNPLGGFYVTNITDAGLPFTGVIEMSALVDREAFGGNYLVYLPKYLTQSDSYWSRTDEEIVEEFLDALQRMYPHFTRDEVVDVRVARAREVQAISTLGYSEKLMPPLETSVEDVFIANSAQIAAGTLNLNETIGIAEAQVEKLLERFGRERRGSAPTGARATPHG